MVDQIFEYLNTSWVGVIITIVLSVIAILLSFIFFQKGKQKFSINHYTESTLLIDKKNTEKPDDVEIYFSKKPVDKLYKTLIYIWNSGNQTIRKNDLNTIDKFRIDIENDSEILSIKIVKTTRNVINFSLNNLINSQIHEIVFDYLDPNDGVVVEIFHNGSLNDLKLKGTIVGISDLIGNKNSDKNLNNEITKAFREIALEITSHTRYISILVLFTGSLLAGFSIFLHMNPNFKFFPGLEDKVYLGMGGGIYIVLGVVLIVTSKKKFPKSLEITKEK